jgi:hypothetical protein
MVAMVAVVREIREYLQMWFGVERGATLTFMGPDDAT